MSYSVGIDLGGTKIEIGLFDSEGRSESSIKTPLVEILSTEDSPQRQKRKLCDHIVATVSQLQSPLGARRRKLVGWGLASAGPVDVLRRRLDHPANFPQWKTWAIADDIEARWHKTTGKKMHLHFQNDAMAAALAEQWVGSAKGSRTSVAITLGTGVGTGVILNGQPAQSRGFGSEWGHSIVQGVPTRQPGRAHTPHELVSVEDFASGTGLVRNAQSRGMNCSSSHEIFQQLKSLNSSSPAVQATIANAQIAQAVVDDLAHALAALLSNLSLGLAPEAITLSGGLMQMREHFLPKALEIHRHRLGRFSKEFLCPVRVSKLKNACLVGAGSLPWRK